MNSFFNLNITNVLELFNIANLRRLRFRFLSSYPDKLFLKGNYFFLITDRYGYLLGRYESIEALKVLFVDELFVHENYRRHKIGTKLLYKLIAYSYMIHIPIVLGCPLDLIKFYENVGFKLVSRTTSSALMSFNLNKLEFIFLSDCFNSVKPLSPNQT